ncbi:probable dolichyl pyrophosphate Man9GlcNAc2 alpha-1,3-glucosyltransferase isoform X1 [Eurosta solidaginis]|uniref:probable dolichyl pyrophosphate Man9GlcNAc2 alpha-1,3-glucosyltransferase isoform X1 n=1 Tax=Eurosta solidaginis TaxID=178769 RepID=UPI0035309309
MKFDDISADIVATVSMGIAIRAIVSLYLYSGADKPPMFGDYEAQRHWQEITANLQAKDWYRNTTDNDLLYWGLDYPPLTAYHSYVLGIIARGYNNSFVELQKSRGLESSAHKSFMRLTVLIADILLYLPALVLLCCVLVRRNEQTTTLCPLLLAMILYPGQILIDNGHFQYNNISLGLCLLAVCAIYMEHIYLTAFLYSLALNYKQMELYHAMPFFVYLLSACFDQRRFFQKLKTFAFLSGIVLMTFAVLWLPWLSSSQAALAVLERLFPIGRGVYEDKVANFWCALNVVYKIKYKLLNQQMAMLCLGVTASFVIPINLHLFFNKSKETFALSLVNTAMAFYLFSFQVHEKSILLVAAPAFCLLNAYPLETLWFLEATVFSMFPLLVKDGLIIPFFVLALIYHICVKDMIITYFHLTKYSNKWLSAVSTGSSVSMLVIALVSLVAPAPSKYPFIWPLIICLYSFMYFFLFFVFCLWRQFACTNLNVKVKAR